MLKAHPDLTSETPFEGVSAPDRRFRDYDILPLVEDSDGAQFTRATFNELWQDHDSARRRHSFEKRRI